MPDIDDIFDDEEDRAPFVRPMPSRKVGMTETTARTPEMLANAFDEFAVNPKGGKMAAIAYKRCASMVRDWLLPATPAALSASPGWRSMDSAPKDGSFLAEDRDGNWMLVDRYDWPSIKPNAVINRRSGRWWVASKWMPAPSASPAQAVQGEALTCEQIDSGVRALMMHKFGEEASLMFDIPADVPQYARAKIVSRLAEARREVAVVAAALAAARREG